MRALWIVPPEVEALTASQQAEKALLGYRMASVRMRAAVAAIEWKRAGNENIFLDPAAVGEGRRIEWGQVGICIVPKFYFDVPPQPWREACVDARRSGCPLVIDICDYPFAKSEPVQSFYSEVLKICDAVVVNSERMAELMAPHVSRHPVLIEDAVLGAMRNPEFAPAGRLRLLWFGHRANLRYLDMWLDSLVRFAREVPCRLTVVTEAGVGAEEVTQQIEARFRPALEARFIEWSLEAMAGALRRSDLVLIPSDPSDAHKAGVSANRIAEALNAGRFAIASPVQSYQDFADAAWLGQDVTEGIRWALANRIEVRSRIRRGQSLVAEKFAPERIGRQWRDLMEGLASPRTS
jgi:glycosyltransferase involved in cell wall biosynthesis